MQISLKLISASSILASVIIAIVAFVPMTIVSQNNMRSTVEKSLASEASAMAVEIEGFMSNVVKTLELASSTMQEVPPLEEIILRFYHALEAMEILYILWGIEEQGNLYALWRGNSTGNNEPYELGIIDAAVTGTTCRQDFYLDNSLLPNRVGILNSTLGFNESTPFNERCGYDPRQRSWYKGINYTFVGTNKVVPHSGKVPPWSGLFMGRQVLDPNGKTLGVLSGEVHTAVFSD